MKKIVIVLLILTGIEAHAQFFRGVGIFVAVNSSMHRYRNVNPKTIERTDPNFLSEARNQYYPDNHHSRELQMWGVGLVGEFLRYDRLRWQTELEYTMKGGLDKEYFWEIDQKAGPAPNLYTQIQWNNFLKYFLYEGDKGAPYLMAGVRLEYTMSYAITSYAAISALRPKVWFSGDVGVGYEFFTWKKWHPFVEFHWNPDVIYQPSPIPGASMRNRTYELRLGIMYRPARKSIDDCNAPKYHGNYY
jgi:hypothetical protein